MPTNRPAALDGPGIVCLIQQNVSTKVFEENLKEVEDDHISAFHEVYAICTCHLTVPTRWAGKSTDKECACMCVPDETVLKECQRLELRGCIPSYCGPAWQRVALAHHQTLTNELHETHTQPPVTKRGRPSKVRANVEQISKTHGSSSERLKKSPYLPVRLHREDLPKLVSQSLVTPVLASASTGGDAHEDSDADLDDGYIADSNAGVTRIDEDDDPNMADMAAESTNSLFVSNNISFNVTQVGVFGTRACGFVVRKPTGAYVCTTCTTKFCSHLTRAGNSTRELQPLRKRRMDTQKFRKQMEQNLVDPETRRLQGDSRRPIPDVIFDERMLAYCKILPSDSLSGFPRGHYSTRQKHAMDSRRLIGDRPEDDFFGQRKCHTAREGIVFRCQDDLKTGEVYEDEWHFSVLLMPGSVAPVVIRGIKDTSGNLIPYDGNNDCIINMGLVKRNIVQQAHILFDWAVIQEFFTAISTSPTNFLRFFNTKIHIWCEGIRRHDGLASRFPALNEGCRIGPRGIPDEFHRSLYDTFRDTIQDYKNLMAVDWDACFSCSCVFKKMGPCQIIYDNSCNLVQWVCQRDPEWLRYHHAHVDGFHHGRTKIKRHKNCSPSSCICDLPSSSNKGSNASLAEQKNSKNKMMAAFLPHLAQDTAHDMLQLQLKMNNQLQVLVNLAEEFRDGIKRCPDVQPTFVVDAINLPRVATMTFYQREHLETGMQTQRQGNPNPLKKRVMISNRHHKAVFKTFCGTSSAKCFSYILHDDKVDGCLDFLQRSRPLFFKMLKFEKKDPDESAPKGSLFSKPTIRLQSDLIRLKDLLLHWSSKNHESHLILPQFACLLQPFLSKTNRHTSEDYNLLRAKASKSLTSLVDHGSSLVEGDTYQMDTDVQKLLRFALRLQIADTTVTEKSCNIRSSFAPRIETLHGKPLPSVTTAPILSGEYFPQFALNKSEALRFEEDEYESGLMKLHVSQAMVCNKQRYDSNDLKPGLFLVYCHSCRLNVGWSFLDEAETVRTCYNVFKHRNFAPGWEPPASCYENFAETPSTARDGKHGSVQHSVSESDGSEELTESEALIASSDNSD